MTEQKETLECKKEIEDFNNNPDKITFTRLIDVLIKLGKLQPENEEGVKTLIELKQLHDQSIQKSKVYCDKCNFEDEASVCIWCYNNMVKEKDKQIQELEKKNNSILNELKELTKYRFSDKKRNDVIHWFRITEILKKK